MAKKESAKAKKVGTPTRDVLYAEAAKHAPRAIEVLVEVMNNGDNDNARMAAAKTILAKAIPDLHSAELTGKNGQPLQLSVKLDMAGGYIPPMGVTFTTPIGSSAGSTSLQGFGVAQKSQEDNNSINGDSQTGTV